MRATLVMALVLASAGPGSGAIRDGAILQQSGQGWFVVLDASQPFAVGHDHFDDDNLYAFDEAQMITLTRPLVVDIGGMPDGVLPIGPSWPATMSFSTVSRAASSPMSSLTRRSLGWRRGRRRLRPLMIWRAPPCAMSAWSCAVLRRATRFGLTLMIRIACFFFGPGRRRGITFASLPQRPATRP